MSVLLIVGVVVLVMGLAALWIWWTSWLIKAEYRDRWNNLNRRVGGILPDYDKMRKD